MADNELIELEEEEHTSQLTAPVFRRILTLLKPHWKWVLGFLITIALTSSLDAYFTYLNKQIVDTGITLGDKERVMRTGSHLRRVPGDAGRLCIHVHLPGRRAGRARAI